MALDQPPIDPFLAGYQTWLDQYAPAPEFPAPQELTVVPVSPSTLGNPEPPKPPPPPPPPVQQIGAASVQTEIAGPAAPAPPTDGTWEPPASPQMPAMVAPDPAVDPWSMPRESDGSSQTLGQFGQFAAGLGFYDKEHILNNPDAEAGANIVGALPFEAKANVLESHDAGRMRKAKDLEQQAHEDLVARTKAAEAAAQRHLEVQQRAKVETEQLLLEARDIANTQIKPETGTARHIIMGLLGGLIQGRTGSATNAGLEMVNREIERDIALQKENLANRRTGLQQRQGLLAEMLARTGDIEKAEAAVRIAGRDTFIAGLESEMQKYDPRGTAIADLVAMRDRAAAQRAQLVQQLYDKNLDRQIKIGNYAINVRKEDRETAKANAEIAKMKAEAAKLGASGGGSGAGGVANDKTVLTPEQMHALYDLPGKPALVPPVPMDGKQYRSWLATQKSHQDRSETERKAAAEQEERLVSLPNGATFMAPKADVAEETRKKIHASGQIASIIDEILDIRDRVGGESSIFNSDERQRLEVLEKRLQLVTKSGTQGMSSDKDMEAIRGAVGASDVSSFRARAAGLKEGRARVVEELNSWLDSHNYKGAPVTFPTRYNAPTQSREDALVQESAASGGGGKLARVAAAASAAADRGEAIGVPSKAEQARVDEAAAAAFGADPGQRTASIARLRAIIENAGSATERAYAIRVFEQAIGGQRAGQAPAPTPEPVRARPAKDALELELLRRHEENKPTTFDPGDWWKEKR